MHATLAWLRDALLTLAAYLRRWAKDLQRWAKENPQQAVRLGISVAAVGIALVIALVVALAVG